MPKLKSLEPIQTQPFKVKVKKVKYFEFENTNKFAPEKSWIANCNCLIVKSGKESKNKSYCNVQLYLTEEEYTEKGIEQNDIILLSDKVKWEAKKGINYKTYNAEKLQDSTAKNVKFDEKGRAYTEDFVYPFVIKAKVGTWKIHEKNDEYFIANIGNTKKVKLIFDSKEELIEFKYGKFSIEQDEFEKLENDNHGEISFIGYAHKQKICSQQMFLDIEFDSEIQKWIMELNLQK